MNSTKDIFKLKADAAGPAGSPSVTIGLFLLVSPSVFFLPNPGLGRSGVNSSSPSYTSPPAWACSMIHTDAGDANHAVRRL